MKFYAKHNKIFSLWKAFGGTEYIARFFTMYGMVDFSFKNDDSFLAKIEEHVSKENTNYCYENQDTFDIVKTILDTEETKLEGFHEKYFNSKLYVSAKSEDFLSITLRIKKDTRSKNFKLDDSFFPCKLICFVNSLK